MNEINFIVPLIIVFCMAVPLGVLIFYYRKESRIRQSFEELARRVHGTISRKSLVLGDILEGQQGGIPFTCRYFMGSKNSPPSLTIRTLVPGPAKITIRRQAWYDRFARQIGLIAELRTGDPFFDQTYFLDTDREDVYQPYFSHEQKRREVEALFGLGFPVREIVIGKKDLRIVLSPFPADAIASIPLEKYLDALPKLVAGLSPAGYSASFGHPLFPGNFRPPVDKLVLSSLFAFNGLLILGGLAALLYGMEQYKTLGNSLVFKALSLAFSALLVYLFFIFRWIRGRSSSHKFFGTYLILSLIGFPLALTGAAVTTNGFWDQGAETSHQVPVTNLYAHKSKNGRAYYVEFPSWRLPEQTDRISVSCGFFSSVITGDEITIRTKPGYWKEEWITGAQKKSSRIRSDEARNDGAWNGFPIRLRSVRFYEGGTSGVSGKDRRYSAEFARETSRFIYCEVNMDNGLWEKEDRSYTFVWQFINPDGDLRGKVSMPFTVLRNWRTAWVSNSWGWENPGNWPPGSYRVMVLADGHPFGEGVFTIR